MVIAITGFIGVLVGAILVYLGMAIQMRHLENKEQRRRELELKVKEIETLNQLNKKINEILQKRASLLEEYVSFDAFDDCYITIDDFAYLQSFSAQNNFYLPNYILDELFQNIAHRKVILSPDETMKIGGYAYKGGRVILENFTDNLTAMINEKKSQLKNTTKQPIGFFSKDDVWS
ncbi:hypothetical protein B835_2480 [Enterococcus mundtii 3F]|uniref:Uncharacterized protein n=2 Tax=Enterococcus mundtii TaxID=53346 RepID=A0A2S7RN82_ENTMU|nr:hypothetical protein [Enterococcus mundtii]MDA9462534.1 hypothetical protein [Enterococcus mundtii 3F]PQF20272.1 hypothetical protein CUS89_15335 [Enterococcus mundtii]PTO38921.1 hypothetical protein C6P52_07055 [Enterococcus mundtii]PTO44007.1 hypothetical protein C6P54_07160 [Enterococcus mundtii]